MVLEIQGIRFKLDREDYERFKTYKWHIIRGGYAATHEKGEGKKTLLMHRMVLDTPKGMFTDHINGDVTDNRKTNLRVCSQSENLLNKHTVTSNKSGAVGIYQKGNRWIAEIKRNGVKRYIGSFLSLEEAIAARADILRSDIESA